MPTALKCILIAQVQNESCHPDGTVITLTVETL